MRGGLNTSWVTEEDAGECFMYSSKAQNLGPQRELLL